MTLLTTTLNPVAEWRSRQPVATPRRATNMKTIKRISTIASIAYCLAVPLSQLIPGEPETDKVRVTHNESGCDIEGTITFPRGGELHVFGYRGPLVVGRAHFTTTSERTYSSTEVLGRIRRGEIQHGPIRWQANWIALVLTYIPIWLGVAFLVWGISGSKSRTQLAARGEQVADGKPVTRPS